MFPNPRPRKARDTSKANAAAVLGPGTFQVIDFAQEAVDLVTITFNLSWDQTVNQATLIAALIYAQWTFGGQHIASLDDGDTDWMRFQLAAPMVGDVANLPLQASLRGSDGQYLTTTRGTIV